MRFGEYFLSLPGLGVVLLFCSFVLLTSEFADAQSTDQNNPTPITTNQINGLIRARDIGDSRLTTYYYVFTGDRGDVFVNVISNNINGTIDIFTLNGLKPRTKITLFADNADGETGRVVYMREAERLVLRIQGRSPNDDPGSFQLKFAGSFVAEKAVAENDGDPRVENRDAGAVRVNSVGTIINEPAAKPKAVDTGVKAKPGDATAAVKIPEDVPVASTEAKPEPVRTDAAADVAEKAAESANLEDTDETAKTPEEVADLTIEIGGEEPKRSALVTISREPPEEETAEEPTLEQKLARVELRITLKSGGSFTRPMNEVLSVNVIKGVLTIVTSDGRIQEFSILEIEKMTIE